MDFIDRLAEVIYTEENLNRATLYLSKERGLDNTKFRYPFVVTGSDLTLFYEFRDKYSPEVFSECLFIPITELDNSSKLAGFDLRYVGSQSYRVRYVKIKRTPQTLLFYYTTNIADIDEDTPLCVTEGAIDAESLSLILDLPVISPLTAMHSGRFCVFLAGISKNVYFAYDNDSDGRKAISHIFENVSVYPEVFSCFHPLNYTGKDPNESLTKFGRDYLKTLFDLQIKGFKIL